MPFRYPSLTWSLLLATLCVAARPAAAADAPAAKRAWFHVNPTTMTMRFALPGNLPKEVVDAIKGLDSAPKKTLALSLWTPEQAPPDAKVEADLPAGLKVDKTVPLTIESVAPPQANDMRLKVKYYLGCNDKAPDGQPITLDAAAVAKRFTELKGSLAAPRDPRLGMLDKDASAKGSFALRSYAGNVSVDVPAAQDFLDPVEILSPKLGSDVDYSKPIQVTWKKVPRAKGYVVMAVSASGVKPDAPTVMWLSANDATFMLLPEAARRSDVQLAEGIKRGWYLGPEVTSCTVPAGIFTKGVPIAVTVTAFGEEKVVTEQVDPATGATKPLVPAIAVAPQSTTMITLGMLDLGSLNLEAEEEDD